FLFPCCVVTFRRKKFPERGQPPILRGASTKSLLARPQGPGALRSLRGSALTDLLGVKGVMKRRGESMDDYLAQMKASLSGRWAQEEGKQSRRDLRIFLLFFFSRVLFATKSSRISLRHLSLLEDLDAVGDYAWGAAVLAELFYNLGSHTFR